MTSDVYQAPQSEILTELATNNEFYVVSSRKFLILFIATLGIYAIYWFYKHWSQFKIKNQQAMWPVMRAIFAIFFVHSLFELFKVRALERNQALKFSANLLATLYIILSITERVADRLSAKEIGSPFTDFLGLLILPFIGWILYKAQTVANLACDQPIGETNNNLTPANYVWIFLGSLVWLLIVIGIYDILFGFQLAF